MARKKPWWQTVNPDVLCFGTMFVLIIIGLSVLGYNWYQTTYVKDEKKETGRFYSPESAQWGDFVQVKYTAYFEDTGQVFETTSEDVAEDDSIPKTDNFTLLEDGSRPIYLGTEPTSPPGPDNEEYYTVKQVPLRFIKGLIGMSKGEEKTISVSPEKGYANYQSVVLPLRKELPRHETITALEFRERYGQEPKNNLYVENETWSWPVIVESLNGDNVSIMHDPEMGHVLSYQSWKATVVAKNTTTITIQHNAKEGMAVEYNNYGGYVDWVDSVSFKIKYDTTNDPRANHVLRYEVKLVEIKRER